MSSPKHLTCLLPLAVIMLGLGQFALLAADSPPKSKAKLYDSTADGKQQIADAIKTTESIFERALAELIASR